MTRLSKQSHPGGRLLLGAVVVLLLLALLPLRVSEWLSWFENPAQFVVSPVAGPVRHVAGWLRPSSVTDAGRASMALPSAEAEKWRARALALEDELRRANDLLRSMKVIIPSDPGLTVRHIVATVTGTAGDGHLLRVKAGEMDGVTDNAVAITSELQIIGRVTSIEAKTCTVRPITSKTAGDAGRVQGAIMVDESGERLLCVLSPVGNGLLRGDVEEPRSGKNIEPVEGQLVRVSDPTWPKNANMLVLGTVESVEPSAISPRRKTVTVRPTILRLEMVSELILRVPPPAEAGGTTGGVPGGGT